MDSGSGHSATAGVVCQDACASMQACQTATVPFWDRRQAECEPNAQRVLNPGNKGNTVSRVAAQDERRTIASQTDDSSLAAGLGSRHEEKMCGVNMAENTFCSGHVDPREGVTMQDQNG